MTTYQQTDRDGEAARWREAELAVHAAATALFGGDTDAHARTMAQLTSAVAWAGSPVTPVLGEYLVQGVAAAWEAGWQPVDLRRAVARKLSARHARLAVAVVGADAARYRSHPRADGRWLAQLDDIGARDPGPHPHGPVATWAEDEGATPAAAVALGVDVLALTWRLPPMPVLLDPPGRWDAPGGDRHRIPDGMDPKMLGRVRALLAKAESTTFAEEAEVYTAKAQHLMTRHSLDRAALEGTGGSGPEGRRLAVDDPYAPAKALLLSEVAAAGRCRVVWSREFGFSTAFGYPSDLDMLEILYTSLLVQATTVMVATGAGEGARYRRSRRFRQSFMVAFARRIGQRLHAGEATSMAEAERVHGPGLLPVLAMRLDAVDEARHRAFPDATQTVLRARDAEGWAAGTDAADRASLAGAEEPAPAAVAAGPWGGANR